MYSLDEVRKVDPEVAQAIESEQQRQNSHIELIASENWVSKAVMAAMGSPLTNKYAEGYPIKTYTPTAHLQRHSEIYIPMNSMYLILSQCYQLIHLVLTILDSLLRYKHESYLDFSYYDPTLHYIYLLLKIAYQLSLDYIDKHLNLNN